MTSTKELFSTLWELSRMTLQLSKNHSTLFREHELLLVELEAMADIS